MYDVLKLNREAWNKQATQGDSPWVQPVDAETIARAKAGDWQVILTPTKTVPRHWFADITGKQVLGLASAGGQQVPTFAAAGANVVSFDNSDEQLKLDQQVAEREGLSIQFEQGDMADLSRFEDQQFDLIFHPVSNVFCEDILPVWRESFRVLKPGGRLLAGFMNPSFFLFDHEDIETGGPMIAKYPLPFRDTQTLTSQQIETRVAQGWAVEFGHSLETQIGGQLAAGFVLRDLYEDHWDDEATPLNSLMPTSIATLAERPI